MTERTIYITDAISNETYKNFAQEMTLLELSDCTQDIRIEICCQGGMINVAYAYVARMRLSPCKAVAVGMGDVASAATLILACADTRYAVEETVFTIHEETEELNSTIYEMEKNVKKLRKIENRWNRLLASKTKLTPIEWTKLQYEERRFGAKKALTLGLIDYVI